MTNVDNYLLQFLLLALKMAHLRVRAQTKPCRARPENATRDKSFPVFNDLYVKSKGHDASFRQG